MDPSDTRSPPSVIIDFATRYAPPPKVSPSPSPSAARTPSKAQQPDALSVIGEETASAVFSLGTTAVESDGPQSPALDKSIPSTTRDAPRTLPKDDAQTAPGAGASSSRPPTGASPSAPAASPASPAISKPLLTVTSTYTPVASDPNLLSAATSSLGISSRPRSSSSPGKTATDAELIDSANALLRQGSGLLQADAHSARQNLKSAKAAALAIRQQHGKVGVRRFRLLSRTALSLALCSRDRARHFADAHHYNAQARGLAELNNDAALAAAGTDQGAVRETGRAASDVAKVLLDESEIWIQEANYHAHRLARVESGAGNGQGQGHGIHDRRSSQGSAHSQQSGGVGPQQQQQRHSQTSQSQSQSQSQPHSQLHPSPSTPNLKPPTPSPTPSIPTHSPAEIARFRTHAFHACEAAVTASSGTCYSVDEYDVLAQALMGCAKLVGSGQQQQQQGRIGADEMTGYYLAQAKDVILQARLLPFPDRRDAEALIATEGELRGLLEESRRAEAMTGARGGR